MPPPAPKPFEPEDPMEIVGVALEEPMGEADLEEMARCFVEEYALLGWDAEHIFRLFRQPYFAGAHVCLQRLGETRVRALIAEVAGGFGEEAADG